MISYIFVSRKAGTVLALSKGIKTKYKSDKRKDREMMRMNATYKQSTKYQMWSEDQCAAIFNTVCRVMAKTGAEVRNEKARELLAKAGCYVEGTRVRIPEGLLRWAVDAAPDTITMYDRLGNPAYTLAPHVPNFGPTNSDTCVWDSKTDTKRRATTQDAINYALLCEGLPNMAWTSTLVLIDDCDARISDIHELRTMLPLSKKPMMNFALSLDNLKDMVEMAEVIAGSPEKLAVNPFIMTEICPVPPFQHTDDGLAQIMFMAEKRLPVLYMTGASMGLAAPITAAGAVATAISDSMVALLVSQLTNPGAPWIACVLGDNVDMTTVHVTYSRPEYLGMLSGAADVFRYLGLPCCSNLGATANGKFDAEAAFETTVALYTSMLSGVNMAFTNGALECGKSSCVEELVFADEVIGFLKMVLDGTAVDEETLAEEVMNNVGPGGNFLMEQHTAIGSRKQWRSDCIKGLTFEDMKLTDMPDLTQRLRARADEIIAAGPQYPLSDEIIAKLDEIVAGAQARINAK